MSSLQKFFSRILPRSWFLSLQKQSKQWIIHCVCGYKLSLWDAGGIRIAASVGKVTFGKCPQCNKYVTFKIFQEK